MMNEAKHDNFPGIEAMTIVVPVYNRARLIIRCLDSIYAQTYRPINVIVVDNASTDGTSAAVIKWISDHSEEGFSATLLYEAERGAAFARRKGLEFTETDKVMFFDSDDVMRPDCVQRVMKEWSVRPYVQVVAWPTAYHYPGRSFTTHSIKGNLIERHLVHSVLRTIGYAVKTSFIRRAGGWKGEFPTWDDFELGVRILLAEPSVIGIRKPLADVYHQDESITGTDYSSKAGSWEHSLDSIESLIEKSGRPDTRRLLNIVNYRRAILAADYAKEHRPDLASHLLEEALKKTPASKRPALRFAYQYTRMGLRGAFMLVSPFL